MTTPPSIAEQAEETELRALEYRDHVEVIRVLAAKGKRPLHEVEHKARRLATILAVAKTMAWLRDNEAKIKGRSANAD